MNLAICIPSRDNVPIGFAKSLANLTATLERNNITYDLKIMLGSVLPDLRMNLAYSSLNSYYILWLDSDMHFPSDTFEKLKSHDKDIVAATYSTRNKPQRSVAFMDQDNIELRLEEKYGLHEVFAVGMGCMLIKTEILKSMSEPWFKFEWDSITKTYSGEDIFFCRTAADHGYKIFVDADLSNELAHYGTKAYLLGETNEHCNKI
jgi:hypothetical protein